MPENNMNDIIQKFNNSLHSVYELSTRMDERVNSHSTVMNKHENIIISLSEKLGDVNTRLALLEDKTSKSIARDIESLEQQVASLSNSIGQLSGRMSHIQTISDKSESRWDGILRFIVQLLWVVAASYLLYKLNLNPPATP